MIKLFCDGDGCGKPIADEDNQIMIANGSAIVQSGKIARLPPLNFCCQSCMAKFFTKMINRPVLVQAANSN